MQLSTTLGHKMSLLRGYMWPKSDQMSTWPKASSWGVHLTKGQCDLKCDQMSTWPKALSWGVHLTKGQPDQKIWQKCQPDPKSHISVPIWLSAEWLSENLNTLCVSCFASQRSFLRKTKQDVNFILTGRHTYSRLIL